MKKISIVTIIALFTLALPLVSHAENEIRVTDFETGIGLGCYGRCGFLSVSFKVKNIAYDKHVGVYYKDVDGEWRELQAHYVRPLEDGYEEWVISQNIARRGDHIEFVGKYEVEGETFWDNNLGQNFSGVFDVGM